MAWRPTDQLIMERVQKYIYPGENLYVKGFAMEHPSWGWILLIGNIAAFFYKYYAVGVKESGLIVTELSMWGYGEKHAAIIPWTSIFNVTYNPGMLQDILGFQTPDGRQWRLRFQKVMGLSDNREAGKNLAQYIYAWSLAAQQQSNG